MNQRHDTPSGFRPRRHALVAILAVVTALVLIGVGWRWAVQPRYIWRVTEVVEPAGVLAATGKVQVGAVQRGGVIRTGPASVIELQLGQELRLRLLEGGEIEIMEPPARLFSGEVLVTLRAGEVYGTTRRDALDLPLRLIARDVEAEIQGATFTVLVEPAFTSIGLKEGSVVATARTGDAAKRVRLADGSKILFYPDGSVSETLVLDEIERQRLQAMASPSSARH